MGALEVRTTALPTVADFMGYSPREQVFKDVPMHGKRVGLTLVASDSRDLLALARYGCSRLGLRLLVIRKHSWPVR